MNNKNENLVNVETSIIFSKAGPQKQTVEQFKNGSFITTVSTEQGQVISRTIKGNQDKGNQDGVEEEKNTVATIQDIITVNNSDKTKKSGRKSGSFFNSPPRAVDILAEMKREKIEAILARDKEKDQLKAKIQAAQLKTQLLLDAQQSYHRYHKPIIDLLTHEFEKNIENYLYNQQSEFGFQSQLRNIVNLTDWFERHIEKKLGAAHLENDLYFNFVLDQMRYYLYSKTDYPLEDNIRDYQQNQAKESKESKGKKGAKKGVKKPDLDIQITQLVRIPTALPPTILSKMALKGYQPENFRAVSPIPPTQNLTELETTIVRNLQAALDKVKSSALYQDIDFEKTCFSVSKDYLLHKKDNLKTNNNSGIDTEDFVSLSDLHSAFNSVHTELKNAEATSANSLGEASLNEGDHRADTGIIHSKFLNLVYSQALVFLKKILTPSEWLASRNKNTKDRFNKTTKKNNSSISTAQTPEEVLQELYQQKYAKIISSIFQHPELAHREKLLGITQQIEAIYQKPSVYNSLTPDNKFAVEQVYPNVLKDLTTQCVKAYENEALTQQTDEVLPLAIQTFSEQIHQIFEDKLAQDRKESQVIYQYLRQKR